MADAAQVKPQRAGIYARISSDVEGKGLGVQRQVEDCEALARIHGWITAERYVDNDISASTKSKKARPEYQRLLADAQAGVIDGIIVYNMDRLTRRLPELATFLAWRQDVGVAFMTTEGDDTESANGRMVINIKGAVAQQEAERISERVTRAFEQRRASGKPSPGGIRPFGFDPTGMHLNDVEAAAIRDGAEMLIKGHSVGDVMRAWERRGITTVTDTHWSRVTVRRTYTSPRIAGYVTYKNEIVSKGEFPAILDESTWHAVLAAMGARGVPRALGHSVRTHVLSGFVYCSECGSRMAVQLYRDDRGNIRPPSRWACVKDRGGCGKLSRKYTWVMEQVDKKIREMLELVPEADGVAAGCSEADSLGADIERLEEEIRHARQIWIAKDIAAEDYYATVADLRSEINGLKKRQAEALREVALPLDVDALKVWEEDRPENLLNRRAIVATLIDRIVIMPVGRGYGGRPLPESSIDVVPR